MKKILLLLSLAIGLAANAMAQGTEVLDERRVSDGIRQIGNANFNYFTNEGWSSTWNTLNSWYADVLVNNQEAKSYIMHALNERAVYDRFNELNFKKQNHQIKYGDIDAFNRYIEAIIWAEIDKLYPPAP